MNTGVICTCQPLTSMDTEVTVVFVECFDGGDVRRSLYYLVHPLDGAHHLVPAPEQGGCKISKQQAKCTKLKNKASVQR